MSARAVSSSSAPVSFRDVTKTFGSVVAVNRLHLDVQRGEFLVLLGPSGCGKTTTLRMLAGLESVTSGTISIGDVVVNDLPPRSRNVAMVFQSYALYPHLTVFDNLAYPLRIRGAPRAHVEARVREVAKLLQIDALLDRHPKQLSGGQRQRVAVGRAIVRQPAVFLMDEPLSNLDAQLRVYTRGELKRLQSDLGVTTVYVTHDQAEAMTLADRVAIMRDAVLQQVGSPREIYDAPANMFVGGFLGSPGMNFLRGAVQLLDGALDFTAEGLRLPLPSAWLGALPAGTATNLVFLGVRPEDIELSAAALADGAPAEVYVSEELGNETLVRLQVAGQSVVARAPSGFPARPGDRLWLRPNLRRAHLFDGQTQRCLV